MTLNKHFVVTLPPTNETVMRHKFNSIKHGGKYKIIISTDVEDAIPSPSVTYTAPDIQPPHQVNVLHKDQGFIIFWQEHDLPSTLNNVKYHYEILVVEGSNMMKESSAKIYKVDQPPYIYKDAKPDLIYTFAVRLVTEEGFQSPLSEVFSTRYSAGNYENYFFLIIPDNIAIFHWYKLKKKKFLEVSSLPVTINTSNILSFAIPICLLIIALGSALAYFVVRHRRLTNSFTQFANSHYDTRRGQATFPGTTDGLGIFIYIV